MKSIYTTALLCYPQKAHTRVGFEPGSFGPQVEGWTTALLSIFFSVVVYWCVNVSNNLSKNANNFLNNYNFLSN
jgi:hypothetical protein